MERVLDINRSFRTMRTVTIMSFAGLCLVTCYFLYKYNSIKDKQEERVYVVTDKGTYAAFAKEGREVTNYEAKFMSELFINSMFAHDADTYEKHMDTGLNLCDKKTGAYIGESFEKGKVKENYKKWGSRTEVEIDSVKLLSNGVPMKVVAYFKQKHLIGSEQKALLPMACRFNLVKFDRYDKNPFGLKVADFDFIAR